MPSSGRERELCTHSHDLLDPWFSPAGPAPLWGRLGTGASACALREEHRHAVQSPECIVIEVNDMRTITLRQRRTNKKFHHQGLSSTDWQLQSSRGGEVTVHGARWALEVSGGTLGKVYDRPTSMSYA